MTTQNGATKKMSMPRKLGPEKHREARKSRIFTFAPFHIFFACFTLRSFLFPEKFTCPEGQRKLPFRIGFFTNYDCSAT